MSEGLATLAHELRRLPPDERRDAIAGLRRLMHDGARFTTRDLARAAAQDRRAIDFTLVGGDMTILLAWERNRNE